jgi:hypothetical protein
MARLCVETIAMIDSRLAGVGCQILSHRELKMRQRSDDRIATEPPNAGSIGPSLRGRHMMVPELCMVHTQRPIGD